MWWVYIIECVDGTLYTGIAKDVHARFMQHYQGRGARYMRAHKPLKVVYKAEYPTRAMAASEEARIKRMSRARKLKLVEESGLLPSGPISQHTLGLRAGDDDDEQSCRTR